MEKIILNRNILIFFFVTITSQILSAGNNFVKSEIRRGELNLYFSSDIESVKYFAIPTDDGRVKYVYDIYGAILPQGKGISHHSYRNIDYFRVAQNSPERVRVVIKSGDTPLNRHSYKGNILTIPLKDAKGGSSSKSKKSVADRDIETKRKYIIVVDAGHGGKDTGASCCKLRKEKVIVLSVAKKVKVRLEKMGYRVYMTRERDNFVKLPNRTKFANRKKADVFISIHANAAPSRDKAQKFEGIEVYYLSPAVSERAKNAAAKENSVMLENKDYYTKNTFLKIINREKIFESHKLSFDIRDNIMKLLRRKYGYRYSGGVKKANFWVLVGAQMPAVLVEIGYITHPQEGANLLKREYQQILADGIARGVRSYLKKNKRY